MPRLVQQARGTLVAIRVRSVMLALMKKGPWDNPTRRPSGSAVDEKFRQYWATQNRRHRRQRLFRQLRLPALVALGSGAAVWALWAYLATSLLPVFGSSPSIAQVRSFTYFRTCAEARAAGAAPMYRGQPGYASYLDADGDGIACEWSWRNWLR